jgi:hypothetical protein
MRRMRVFPLQGIRQIHTPKPFLEVAGMKLLHLMQMVLQRGLHAVGQHGHPIVRALTLADRQLAGGKIDVFDP